LRLRYRGADIALPACGKESVNQLNLYLLI